MVVFDRWRVAEDVSVAFEATERLHNGFQAPPRGDATAGHDERLARFKARNIFVVLEWSSRCVTSRGMAQS
jgi:hypothetical protein